MINYPEIIKYLRKDFPELGEKIKNVSNLITLKNGIEKEVKVLPKEIAAYEEKVRVGIVNADRAYNKKIAQMEADFNKDLLENKVFQTGAGEYYKMPEVKSIFYFIGMAKKTNQRINSFSEKFPEYTDIISDYLIPAYMIQTK